MRRSYVLLIIFLLASAVYAQNKPAEKAVIKSDTKTEVKKEIKNDKKTENKDTAKPGTNEEKSGKIPDGYGNLTWGMYLSDARDKITGILSFTDEKRIIISKDNEVEYYYGFFYKEPSAETVSLKKEELKKEEPKKNEPKKDETKPTTDKQSATTPEKDEGKLLYVSITFPYLDRDQVYQKIQQKYGNHTGENVKDNQGAMTWDSENTIVIMWIDQYEKKPFCRKIIYISKKYSQELNDYTNSILNKSEKNLVDTMKP